MSADPTWRCTLDAVRSSLRQMPDSAYRRYCEWILDRPSYARRWLQLVAVAQLVRMDKQMLDGLLTEAESARMAAHTGVMNAYLMYEIASDHLAMGLCDRTTGELGYEARVELLLGFDAAMLARLGGEPAATCRARLLALEPAARRLSLFQHSLAEDEHAALVDAYVAACPSVAPEDVEYAAIPLLIANVESAVALAERLRGCASAALFRDSLERRYRAVDELLLRHPGADERLLELGTAASLVVPMLAYYAGVVAEVVRPLGAYAPMLADGTLQRAFEDAAFVVRVLNDCGTRLLEQTAHERLELVAELHAVARAGRCETVGDVLLACRRPGDGALLTRIRKDLAFGEFNLCLDGVRDLPASSAAVETFRERLELVSSACADAERSLQRATREIARQLGTDLVSAMITRFVAFQRATYAHAFETPQGDYAVKQARAA